MDGEENRGRVAHGLWLDQPQGDRGCWRERSVKSYCAAAFSKMERKGDTDRGTILFDYGWKGRYGEDYRAGLFGIPGPSRVEALIDRTLLAGKEKGGAL